jgi:homoserine kinase type II
MAVFTSVTLDELRVWAAQFPVGQAQDLRGISSGIENSNFFVSTATGEYVLTIFEKLGFEELPFYLNLMRHLAERGVLVPAPVPTLEGELMAPLAGKPAALVAKLEGGHEMHPRPVHCAAVGAMLARMHMAASDFPLHQPNLRGLPWLNQTAPQVLPFLDEDGRQLLEAEMQAQQSFAASPAYAHLPRGPIHADLFRNNVMFDGERLTGFFDFYFAGVDSWIFDVAVTANDWCIDIDSGALDGPRLRALLDAYHAVRRFTAEEQTAWPAMLRAGALRFWLSRLYDLHMPREAEMLTPHDPRHFERILRQRVAHSAPPLY